MERALFDVYLDGTVTAERAKRLLSYLYLARFVDRRTRLVDIRVIVHNEESAVLVDIRLRMEIGSQGQMTSSTEVWKLPLQDYFDGSAGHLSLFVVEVLVAVLALALCISSVGYAHRFVHRLYESIIRRLHQRVVHRHFVIDAWTIAVEALQLAIPACLLAASIVHFVYFFAYVRNFSYERSYRWYDGDGSAAARILLPKRLADPQPPVEGYPRGAWRHTLPADMSERDAYLALLHKVDVMTVLNGWYLGLQVPILLGIAANIVRQFIGLPMLYPYMRTVQRGLMSMLLIAGILMFFTALCAYALHILIGYRAVWYSRAYRAIETLAEYLIGDSTGLLYRINVGRFRGVAVVGVAEHVALALVQIFYPLIAVFVLVQFLAAILLDFFSEERQRRIARGRLDMRKETNERKLARQMMRNSGHFDEARDTLSGVFYNLGWRNLSAFVFTGNVKWLDPRRELRGFDGRRQGSQPVQSGKELDQDVTSPPDARTTSPADIDSSTHPAARWKRAYDVVRATRRAALLLEDVVRRSRDGSSKPFSNASRELMMTSGNIRNDGLQTDAARYLRMHQANRRELVVPVLGLLGPMALGEVMHELHAMVSKLSRETSMWNSSSSSSSSAGEHRKDVLFRLDVLEEKEFESPSKGRFVFEVKQSESFGRESATGSVDVTPSRLRQHPFVTATIDKLLYSFVTREDQVRMESTTIHLQEAKKRQIVRDACHSVAIRIVQDIGWSAGSEFDHHHGVALAEAVLRRARDTANGMSAVIADMIVSSEELPNILQNRSTRLSSSSFRADSAYSQSQTQILRTTFVRLKKLSGRDLVDTAWKVGGRSVAAVASIPWLMAGAMLNITCGRSRTSSNEKKLSEVATAWDDVDDRI